MREFMQGMQRRVWLYERDLLLTDELRRVAASCAHAHPCRAHDSATHSAISIYRTRLAPAPTPNHAALPCPRLSRACACRVALKICAL